MTTSASMLNSVWGWARRYYQYQTENLIPFIVSVVAFLLPLGVIRRTWLEIEPAFDIPSLADPRAMPKILELRELFSETLGFSVANLYQFIPALVVLAVLVFVWRTRQYTQTVVIVLALFALALIAYNAQTTFEGGVDQQLEAEVIAGPLYAEPEAPPVDFEPPEISEYAQMQIDGLTWTLGVMGELGEVNFSTIEDNLFGLLGDIWYSTTALCVVASLLALLSTVPRRRKELAA